MAHVLKRGVALDIKVHDSLVFTRGEESRTSYRRYDIHDEALMMIYFLQEVILSSCLVQLVHLVR